MNSNASSIILERGKHKILVDFGRGLKKIPDDVTEIIISHAHPDHAFGLKGMILSVPVFMNKFSNKILSKENYPFRRKVFWRNPFHLGQIKITPVPVKHSIKAPASGLIFDIDNKRIAYFPDVLKLKDMEVLKGISLYIGDGASLDRDLVRKRNGLSYGHASIRTQLEWLRQAKVPRAVFMHFGKWALQGNLKRLFRALSSEFGISVRGAFGNYKVRIGKGMHLENALPGIELDPPHAANIIEGYQTLIVTPKPAPISFLSRVIYFLQDSHVYGRLRLTRQHGPVSFEEVMKLNSQHQMTADELRRLGSKEFYYYEFKLEEVFIPPRDAKNIKSWRGLESAEKIQRGAETESPFAPVHHYGDNLGRKIKLKDVLTAWEKPIVLKRDFITLIGGLANWGETHGDIDILQADAKEVVSRDQPILFRLGRALPGDFAERIRRRFIGEYGGAFTSHVPIYDLVLLPSSNRRLVKMQRIEAIQDTEGRRQAKQSFTEDKVISGRYVAPLKGQRAYYKFSEVAAAEIQHEYSSEDYPLYVQKKYDGAITEWLKDGDQIIVRTDSGFDVTHRLPKTVELAKKILPKQCTILCETELWVNEEHQPREVTSGYLNPRSKEKADDSNIVLNVFDIMYDGEDLHKLGYAERYSHMRKITFGQSTDQKPKFGFNLTPSVLVGSPGEIQSALEKTSSYIASEGSVLKSSKMTYELDGLTRKMLKWKKQAEIHAIVLRKEETRTKGVYTLYVGVRRPQGWKVPTEVMK